MGTLTDDLVAHFRGHAKIHPHLIDGQKFTVERHLRTEWCRRAVRDIHMSPHAVMAGVKHVEQQVAAGAFHKANHMGGGQDPWAFSAQKFDGGFVAYFDNFFPRCADTEIGHDYYDLNSLTDTATLRTDDKMASG